MTETTRRALLRTGAAALVLAPFASARDALAAAASRPEFYTRSRFRRQVGRSFRLVTPTRSWRMRLTKVTDLPSSPAGDRHRFAVTFTTARPGPPQGSYLVRRNRFTSTQLFVVPSDPQRRTYTAVINRAPRGVS